MKWFDHCHQITGRPANHVKSGKSRATRAAHLPDLKFPAAKPRVMLPKRTFWEKATAVHVFCKQGTQGDRLSRHWHDLVRLDDADYAAAAFDDRALAKEVAEFKAKFFRAKDSKGNPIDYLAAVSGALQLVHDPAALKTLEADYKKMADDGILRRLRAAGEHQGQGNLTVPSDRSEGTRLCRARVETKTEQLAKER